MVEPLFNTGKHRQASLAGDWMTFMLIKTDELYLVGYLWGEFRKEK